MKVLFLYRRPILVKLAERAAALVEVELVSLHLDQASSAPAVDVVIAPLEACEEVQQAEALASARLILYARQAHERAAEAPSSASLLELPFRVDDLVDALQSLAGEFQHQSRRPQPGLEPGPGPGPGPNISSGMQDGERNQLQVPVRNRDISDAGTGESSTPAGAQQPSADGFADIPAETSSGYKLLAVDDDRVVRRLYERVLGEAGYDVLTAEDGEDAWSKLPGYGPDLVISDVEMPRLDGYALCKRIKEHPQWSQTPVIICSSLSQGRDVVRAFESGTDDYLIKPIHEDELLSRVSELLATIEQGGREEILVVDDSRIIRNLIRGGLSKQGFEVDVAEDGQEALEKIEAAEAPPAIVISDFEMPRMGGFDLGMALRQKERTRRIPLIMMSARDDTRNRKLMKAAGAVAFLGKPFETDKMVALVERVLAEERLKEEKRRIRELIADDAMAQMVREVRLGRRAVARSESMTLLFSDLKGFSTMCSNLSPEEVVELLNGYFDAMIPPIRDHEGDVDKFIGDAIMARFRDPDDGVEREPSPLRAIRAGLGMLEALQRYNGTLPSESHLHMRIGVNYGEVVIGAIGSASRRDFTTIGDNVNRAQRLESNASIDGVLIAQPTYELVKDGVRVEKRAEKVKLKGIPEPVDAYDVLGVD